MNTTKPLLVLLLFGCESTDTLSPKVQQSYHLEVVLQGAGHGVVRSYPAALECLDGICRAEFPSHGIVALEAIPAPGSVFGGWGPTMCPQVSSPQCYLDAGPAVDQVFATFDLADTPAAVDAGVPEPSALADARQADAPEDARTESPDAGLVDSATTLAEAGSPTVHFETLEIEWRGSPEDLLDLPSTVARLELLIDCGDPRGGSTAPWRVYDDAATPVTRLGASVRVLLGRGHRCEVNVRGANAAGFDVTWLAGWAGNINSPRFIGGVEAHLANGQSFVATGAGNREGTGYNFWIEGF